MRAAWLLQEIIKSENSATQVQITKKITRSLAAEFREDAAVRLVVHRPSGGAQRGLLRCRSPPGLSFPRDKQQR